MTDDINSQTTDAGTGLVSRRSFLGATSIWTGAFATRPFSNHAVATSASTPATMLQQFLGRLDREPPFSFRYGGQPSEKILATWKRTHTQIDIDGDRTEHSLTWSAPKGGLTVKCIAIEYHDFPTVEWTIYFTNKGDRQSPAVSAVLAVDTTLQVSHDTAHVVLHSFAGSTAAQTDYQPNATTLPTNVQRYFSSQGGRPTNGMLPYFNIDGGSQGIIAALGWPGQWSAQITSIDGAAVRLQAGMSSNDPMQYPVMDIMFAQLTDLWLAPGEEIRTPMAVLQFWHGGDWIDAQNTWRRWMIAHNMPRLPVETPSPMCPTGLVCTYYAGLLDRASDEIAFMDRYAAERMTVGNGGACDHWWTDAGWYDEPAQATDWTWVGTWQPNRVRYPHGLRPVTNRAHKYGMKTIVWHEPERVVAGTWLYNNHHEWLLGPGSDGNTWLLDLGNKQAWHWAVEHFDQLIRSQGIDVFRQDFNMDPLDYWNAADPAGRSGITQIRHVTGYLSFWDELRRRHPKLLIDSCASGGRRNDLETLRRAVPLWRSDYQSDPIGQQGQTYGLSFWVPYYGAAVSPQPSDGTGLAAASYVMRCSMAPSYAVSLDVRTAPSKAVWDLMRRMTHEWREIAPNLLGDYYPLTDYNVDANTWMAYQFHRAEAAAGIVLAFRRPDSLDATQRFVLRGLEPTATYELTNFDMAGTKRVSGSVLMHEGLVVQLHNRPAAATIAYKRVPSIG